MFGAGQRVGAGVRAGRAGGVAVTLTPAQRRALEWLPATGEWQGPAGPQTTDSLFVLSDTEPPFVERMRVVRDEWLEGDRWFMKWRLTPAGVAERGRVGQ